MSNEAATNPKLRKIWLDDWAVNGTPRLQLRADFSNDRHHAVLVAEPHGPRELALALHALAAQIVDDPHLRPKST